MTSANPYVKLKSQSNPSSAKADIIDITPQLDIPTLRRRIQELEAALAEESKQRVAAEMELQLVLDDRDRNWQRVLSAEEKKRLKEKRTAMWIQHQITGKKSDGKAIARAADSLESYTQMKLFLDTLKATGRMGVRNWAIFRVGICLGLRVSDLMQLRWEQFLTPDGTWRERIPVMEQKTSKANLVLITEAVVETLDEYRKWNRAYNPNGYVFTKNNGQPLEKKTASQILVDINQALQLCNTNGKPIHVSSHTMRKTFANIIITCYDGTMEIEAIDKARAALNHDDLSSTKHYLSTIYTEVDNARKAVSDFVLGKTEIDKLGVPKMKTNNELYDALEELRRQVDELKNGKEI